MSDPAALQRHLLVALDAARQAAEIIRRPIKHLGVREKPRDGLVTEIDQMSVDFVEEYAYSAPPEIRTGPKLRSVGETDESDEEDASILQEQVLVVSDRSDEAARLGMPVDRVCVARR